MDGIIVIDKEVGMTSHDVVAKVRRIMKMKRVGHSGTLDPAVSGVLPVCLGKGTRMVEYLQDMPKEYVAELTLGVSTDTEDQTGTITESTKVGSLPEKEIQRVAESFIGEIEQIPPMYSAVKVDGKRLYQLAREGREVERKPRKAHIYQLDILSTDLKKPTPVVRFRVLCSKGTYVRTLCVEIGKALGYPAHMSHLVRTATGPFRQQDAVRLETLEKAATEGKADQYVLPISAAVQHLPKAVLRTDRSEVLNGKTLNRSLFEITFKEPKEDTLLSVFHEDGTFLAIYQMQPDSPWLKPIKVFS